jgi:hypothetical protein
MIFQVITANKQDIYFIPYQKVCLKTTITNEQKWIAI